MENIKKSGMGLQTAAKCGKMIHGYEPEYSKRSDGESTQTIPRQREKLHRLKGLPSGRLPKFAPERPARTVFLLVQDGAPRYGV